NAQEGSAMAAEKREMTVREAGKKGGTIVSQRYGKEFYEEIGKKGGSTTKNKYGADFYGQIGKKGGQTTSERHGPEFYEKIGNKGGRGVKELTEGAKAGEPGGPGRRAPAGRREADSRGDACGGSGARRKGAAPPPPSPRCETRRSRR